MSYQDYKIIWQKWSNPFGSQEELDLMNQYMQSSEEEVYTEEELEQIYQDGEEFEESETHENPHKLRVIATPMGIMPLTENTDICHIFNFWIGHANFDITKEIVSILETIEGVETLDIFTRYRFRIGVGKAFNDSQVMRNINDSIYEYLNAS
jgi:hypothetical protein